jgi:RHO1 GDP-GTP exchange protein 1/2
LSLADFTEPVIQRNNSLLLRTLRSNDRQTDTVSIVSRSEATDTRGMYPSNIIYHGRNGGPFILYAESNALREEWKRKLDEALGLRKVVQESNKVFEIESLSVDTFRVPPFISNPGLLEPVPFTGDVTCSVPFSKILEEVFFSR